MSTSGGSESKNLCCWCCASGPIEGEVRTDRTGYVPGEYVIASGTLSNFSSSQVRMTSMEIVKIVSYYTPLRTRTDRVSLTKEYGPECRPRGEVNLNNVKLQIPPVPPSQAKHCSIMDINYAVMLMGHLRTCAINFRAYAPIIIGTVPLNNLHSDFPASDTSGEQIFTDRTEMPATTSQATFGVQPPPPTYMAATSGGFDVRGKDENTMGDQTYTPQYKYYDWNQSAFSYK